RQEMLRLRQAFGVAVILAPSVGCLALAPDRIGTDLQAIRDAGLKSSQALALYRGPLLQDAQTIAGTPFATWLDAARQRAQLAACRRLAEAIERPDAPEPELRAAFQRLRA